MLNIFFGFEEANKYAIRGSASTVALYGHHTEARPLLYAGNESGETLGYIVEEDGGFLSTFRRQAFATHRPFRAVIMDVHGTPLLWVRLSLPKPPSVMNMVRPRSDALLLGSIPGCTCNGCKTITPILPKANPY